MNICVVIPHFDHLEQFHRFLPDLVEQRMPLLVVDDASPKQTTDALAQLLEKHAPGSILVRHHTNLGRVVLSCAGFTHALQIDADGQHGVSDIAAICAAAAASPNNIICGQPVFETDIPKLRHSARYITLWFSWLETLSTTIRDALCGFRLYPLAATVAILDSSNPGRRMAFDPEILVRAIWAGIPLQFVPVRVRYPKDGKSHFHYFRDNLEITWMHTRLIFGMLARLPRLIRSNHIQRNSHSS